MGGKRVAENVRGRGSRARCNGVTRDYVIGLEWVPDGEVVRAGRRTHQGRVGYDPVTPFSWARGDLGVATEITVQLIPLPPKSLHGARRPMSVLRP